jgi:RIO-like serine/threonine protein kinase
VQKYSNRKYIIKTLPKNSNTTEIDIYTRLSNLQGRVIPRYCGVGKFQHGEQTVDAFMLEHADGTPLTDFTQDTSSESELKDAILQAYDELSRNHVIHGDIEERHIFVEPQMTVMLIDFDCGEICGTEYEAAKQNRIDLTVLFEKRGNRLAYSSNV